jgi:acyl transferase domain-containing protein
VEDIAIVGMACIFPGAPDLPSYWNNIISKVDAVGDPPEDWEAERFFDANSSANDRIYCKRGGYLGDLARFSPLKFGVMPSSLDGGEPDHYLSLRVAKEAMLDAGYKDKSAHSDRTEVIVGRGTYINRGVTNSFQHTVVVEQTLEILKELHPDYTERELQEIKKKLKESLPPFNGETVSSLVPNILTGRIANRLDLMGTNYLVDAACASSLVAVEHGMRDLISGKCDLALVGGVNASIPPTMLVIFSQINALSRKQHLRPFDESVDGTMLGEGLGFVVLKRKSDAEKDGDRIYAVLKSVGVASDGRALGLLSPRLEGEALAISRAYDATDISPDSIELVEAHGTGTPLGDVTEVQALMNVFGEKKGNRPSCALGTVKSMIGHLIPASGMAGLIKTALALYHKVLPPTLCEKLNPALELDRTPFYINTETRPWIHGNRDYPRRASVNAFGFGGINAHAILEEYQGRDETDSYNLHNNWDSEVFLFKGESRPDLIKEMVMVNDYLGKNPDIFVKDLAYTLNTRSGEYPYQLAIVAGTAQELSKKIINAADRLQDPSCKRIRTKSGIYYFDKPLGREGKVAFLFPGEGSQYVNMFSDLCMHFPEVRESFDLIDSAFAGHGRGYLPTHAMFPLPLNQEKIDDRLWAMDSAAESVFAANQAMLKLMTCLELKPDIVLGHSTGEYSALLASGIINTEREDQYIDFVLGVNSVYEDLSKKSEIADGILLSVGAATGDYIKSIVEQSTEPLYIAMENCPNQVILCGSEKAIARAEELLRKEGAIVERLPFQRAYHTPLFEAVCAPLLDYFKELDIHRPEIKTYSCVSAHPYPDDPHEIRKLATSQWARRVRFIDAIEAMYKEGVRIFVEVGARGNLTSFVDDILRKREYLAMPSNLHRRSGTAQLNHLVGLLTAHHVKLNTSFLYKYRKAEKLSFDHADRKTQKSDLMESPVKIDLTLPRLKLKGFTRIHSDIHRNKEKNTAPSVHKQMSAPSNFDARSEVMMEHLKNMDQFIASQKEVFQMYIKERGNGTFAPKGHAGALEKFDRFMQEMESQVSPPGTRAEVASAKATDSGYTNKNDAESQFAPSEKVTDEIRGKMSPSAYTVKDLGSLTAATRRKLPFIREIVSFIPEKEAVSLCTLDFREDRFLLDHTLGGKVSEVDNDLSALSVVPLTFSMEILAEGAALLMPGKKLVGMREIRAYRWIGLDRGSRRPRFARSMTIIIKTAKPVYLLLREP